MPGLVDESRELIDRHFEPAERETVRNRYCVLRAFVRLARLLALRRAHQEATQRDHHKLWTAGAFPESVLRLERAFLRIRQRRLARRRRGGQRGQNRDRRGACTHR